jgi:hypothetical protein
VSVRWGEGKEAILTRLKVPDSVRAEVSKHECIQQRVWFIALRYLRASALADQGKACPELVEGIEAQMGGDSVSHGVWPI